MRLRMTVISTELVPNKLIHVKATGNDKLVIEYQTSVTAAPRTGENITITIETETDRLAAKA